MLTQRYWTRSTAARLVTVLAAAALIIWLTACGDDDGTNDATATPEPATSTPTGGATPPYSTPVDPAPGGVLDIASGAAQFVVYGKTTDSLLSGSTNVAMGDFNDDGNPDLLVGSPGADGPDDSRTDGGEAYVFFGPLEGELDLLEDEPDITIYAASPGDALGFTVHAGDLNDDGIDEIMVGAPAVTAGFDPRTDQGRLYVFYGDDDLDDIDELDLVEDVYDLTVTGAEGFSRLSTAVDLGDVNGDGRTDLLISSPFGGRAPDTPPGSARTAEGEVYIIFGEDEPLTGEYNMAAADYDVLLGGDQEFGQFGAAFAVGDFDGDGRDDVVVGALRNNAPDGRPSAGEAFVFFGRDEFPRRLSVDGAQDATIQGAVAGSALGFPIVAGDFNGDGVDDFALGAQSEGIEDLSTAGSIRLFYGRESFPNSFDLSTEDADATVLGSNAGFLLPTAMTVGDTDGDGVDDLVFSSALGGISARRSTAGLIYVLAGSPELPARIELESSAISRVIIGPSEQARAGAALWFGPVEDDNESRGLALLATGVSPADEEERQKAGAVYLVNLEAE